ncbi:hypothetical protein GCM10010295_40780 [Streptomyces intermedius]
MERASPVSRAMSARVRAAPELISVSTSPGEWKEVAEGCSGAEGIAVTLRRSSAAHKAPIVRQPS